MGAEEPVQTMGGSAQDRGRRLDGDDRYLLDLVQAVLTDRQMGADAHDRLHQEILELLQGIDRSVYDSAVRRVHDDAAHAQREPSPPTDPRTAELLKEVLTDPNLHTDTRMRLYHEIPRLVQKAGPGSA